MNTEDTTTRGFSAGPLHCPQCGNKTVSTQLEKHSFPYGVGDASVMLSAIVPLRVCGDCGIQYLDAEGERLRHEAICHHLGLLTPAQIKAIRKRSGRTRHQFAELTYLGSASLARWERGIGFQTYANDRYLRLLSYGVCLGIVESMERGEETQVAVGPRPLSVVFKHLKSPVDAQRDAHCFSLNGSG